MGIVVCGHRRTGRLLAGLLLACLGCIGARGQDAPSPDLVERQRAVRERLARLENRMLELASLLARSEPEKAERLRDTLDMAGARQVRRKLDDLLGILERGALSEADATQQVVLGDLAAMLELLTSSLNELDRLREERQRLAALQQTVRELLEQQRRLLYQTQRAREQAARKQGLDEPAEAGDPSREQSDEADETRRMINRLEELQRELQQQTGAAAEDFPQPAEEGTERFPGEQSLEQAEQRMQEAADQLGQQQPGEAEPQQVEAMNQMQQTVDRLEETLRQLRQEEREETLAALAARLKTLLSQERRVQETVAALRAEDVAEWARLQELQLAEARTLHGEALTEMDATVRILIEEGTSIVIPDLLQEVQIDMQQVAGRLARSAVDAGTAGLLDDIVAALEELLAAVEQQQDKDAEPPPDGQQQGMQQDGPRPLFNRSAELKLLRSSQVRINRRTSEAGPGAARDLSRRQLRLADQARRLSEAE